MRSFSLKVKILITIVSLTLMSLVTFSLLTFHSYKKDKLAFVYNHLASETQSRSLLISSSIGHYDFLLGSIISGISNNTKSLSPGTRNFFDKHEQLQGVYVHVPKKGNLSKSTLYEKPHWGGENFSWEALEKLPIGLSLHRGSSVFFVLKKALSVEGGFGVVVFKDLELVDSIKSSKGRLNFLLNGKELLGEDSTGLSQASHQLIQQKLEGNRSIFGLFETTLGDENYFISFARLPYGDLVLVSLIHENKVLLIQSVLMKQTMIFLLLMGSISLLVGTLSSRWLTLKLDDLTTAAQELEKENFDHQVVVDSNDELGTLGNSFNSMSRRIQGLLEELRMYAGHLEEMVEQRTRELKQLSEIQRAMLNSLGQGFVIVNKDHQILPVYSKVAVDMFEVTPDESEPSEILGLTAEEAESFKELYGMVFEQMLDFDDMASMHPDFRTNGRGQKIQLSYAPIMNGEGGLDYILIIGTDKTQEIENMEKFKKEWNFSQMMMRIVSNRYALNKVIKESLGMINSSLDALESSKEFAAKEVQRYVHTIKGSFSYFHVEEITHLAHDLESYLEPYFDTQACPPEVVATVLERLMALQVAIECYVDHYDDIIQFKKMATHKTIPVESLERFSDLLREQRRQDLKEAFEAEFYRTEIRPFFEMYPSIVRDLGLKLNKSVNFVLEGGEQSLPDGQWDELFGQFIHFIRNSVDHGIESESERLENGKSASGEIRFQFAVTETELLIELADDGKGIDWHKIAAKDPSVTSEEEAIDRIIRGGVSSKDEVSDVSGRGVGVSAIFATVARLGGKVDVHNKIGHGLRLSIKMPLKKEKLNLKTAA